MTHMTLCVCEVHRNNSGSASCVNTQNRKKAVCVCTHTHGKPFALPPYYSPTIVPKQTNKQQVWYQSRPHSEVTGYV